MKALCLVAHPDDCVIFAYSYIYHHPEHNWTIGYLTYTEQDPRGREYQQFWQRRNIPTVFLGFEDHWHDNEQKQLTRWYGIDAAAACWNLAKDFDLVLTHDEYGDYGHIHHCVVNDAVKYHPGLITFAKPGQGTTYILPDTAYTLEEFPLTADVVRGFHSTQHRNSYKEQI